MKTESKTPFGEPDHIPHSETERRFDEQSKENYERIDREVMDALKPLLPYERKAVRKTIDGMERFTVWLYRITFMLFLFAYWCVEHPKCLAAQERVKALEERVEQLSEMLNPTEATEGK